MTGSTFSDVWHRVSDLHVGLLPTVQVHKQLFRGQVWYVLKETYSQRFYRVTPAAYRFLSKLSPRHTVGEVWQNFLENEPEEAPGQEDVVQMLSQLHFANLLYFRNEPDSGAMFERYRKVRQRELRGKLLAFLYVRLPLWNPDAWLDRIFPVVRFFTLPFMLLLWVVAVGVGLKEAIEHGSELVDRSQGLLAPGNLVWLYVSMAILKFLHELGHAFVCKRFGGHVHTLGVMFIVFTPLPYMDASDAWAFRSSGKRAMVSAAGMYVELFLAGLGAIVWANTGSGLINSLAFNIMIIGSVSSLLFNGNPLLRFDAYYILADLVGVPNLYQRGQKQWLYFGDKYILGTPSAESPAEDSYEWYWLTNYGLLSFLYRIFVMIAILLFVADQWFFLGVIVAVTMIFAMAIMPAGKFVAHLFSPRLNKNRLRAVSASLGAFGLLALALGWIPFPDSIRAPGVVEAAQATHIYNRSAGRLEKLWVENGASVDKGQKIAKLNNTKLEHDLTSVREQLRETRLLRRQALNKELVKIAPLEEREEALKARKTELKSRKENLLIRAPHDGIWVGSGLEDKKGNWVRRGQPLGEVLGGKEEAFRFVAVVRQNMADALFQAELKAGEVRLNGQSFITLNVRNPEIIPFQKRRLPSAALGWMGGGEIPVRQGGGVKGKGGNGKKGRIAKEAFYEIRARLPTGKIEDLTVMDGMTGEMRIPTKSRPIFTQAWRALSQLLQDRYQI